MPQEAHYGTYIGGLAIAIRQEITQHITIINSVGYRIIAITLQHRELHTTLAIINTYVPRKDVQKQTKKPIGEK